ncbi:hypothetical protein [Shouchella clausii]|uniref:hypothetical protein n=1 Tax=Shouchella clausii TaxID=79880 RepID=UPI00128B3AEC|nr:hypothetical protein [Shouchella clausii]
MVGAVIYWHLHFHLIGRVNRLLSMAGDGPVATAAFQRYTVFLVKRQTLLAGSRLSIDNGFSTK